MSGSRLEEPARLQARPYSLTWSSTFPAKQTGESPIGTGTTRTLLLVLRLHTLPRRKVVSCTGYLAAPGGVLFGAVTAFTSTTSEWESSTPSIRTVALV